MADYIGATPIQNPLMGLLAERLKQAQEFAAKPFGYSNPPAEMIMNLLGVPAVQQTAERLAYGEPLTTGRGMTTQIRPEVVEAAMTIAPTAGLLGNVAERGAMAAGRAGERYAEKVVPQIMERGGLPAQLLGDLSQGSIRPMDVWHGSPHGPFEKFDPTKIGSGEGAQAFSYGHYLGEARGTGEEYRRMLSTKVDLDGKPLYDANKIVGSTGNADLDDYLVANLGDVTAARKNILDDIKYVAEGNPESAKEMQKTLDALDKLKVDKKEAGYLYKVDLPDEAIANMLDWDKPLSKQPEKVKNWLKDTYNPYKAELTAKDIGGNEPTGSLIYNRLQELMSEGKKSDVFSNQSNYGAQNASRELAEYGIPGVRYLDEGSRAAGKGTSNFVVFPGGEDLLTIKEINDKPVGGLLGQSKAAEATDLLSYRGSHTAPGPDFGAPLHDLTGGGQMYPADVYSPKAAQYYGTGYPKADKEAFALANKVRGNPDAEVTMYRAVPKNESIKDINAGDWVTLSKEYAKNHGESVLDNDYKILSKKVKAKDLWTNADSIHEFGYWPE